MPSTLRVRYGIPRLNGTFHPRLFSFIVYSTTVWDRSDLSPI